MAVVKKNHFLPFDRLHKGAPFAATLTLYTKSEGREDPKEHFFYKSGAHRAVTLDKRITVHFPANTKINLCAIEKR